MHHVANRFICSFATQSIPEGIWLLALIELILVGAVVRTNKLFASFLLNVISVSTVPDVSIIALHKRKALVSVEARCVHLVLLNAASTVTVWGLDSEQAALLDVFIRLVERDTFAIQDNKSILEEL